MVNNSVESIFVRILGCEIHLYENLYCGGFICGCAVYTTSNCTNRVT